jgi:F-type H+-transporting ATPase subunit alpha
MFKVVEVKAPDILSRQPVYESLFVGYIGIDGVLPLGRGQRELIIGDRQTGKTSIGLDAIINQSGINTLVKSYAFIYFDKCLNKIKNI